MGIFSRKPHVGIEDFCQEFYDSQIFHPIIGGIDVGAVFWEHVIETVTEVDPSFAAIDPAAFQREMIAVRLCRRSAIMGHI